MLEQERAKEMLRGKQVRTVRLTAPQLRAEETEGKKYLRGYPILFDVPTSPFRGLPEYQEEIGREALDGLDLSELRVLINHNPDLLMGREGRNARHETEEGALFIETEVHSGVQFQKDYYALVKAGILDGMSFAFMIAPDGIKYVKERDVYRITKISDLWEVSFVTFPAYEQTVAIAREQQKPDMGLVLAAEAEPAQEIPEQREAEAPPADMGLVPGPEEREAEEPAKASEPAPVDAQERDRVLAELNRLLGGNTDNA